MSVFTGYLALGKGSGSFTEETGTSYARQAINLVAATGRRVSNDAAITFTAGANWTNPVTQYAIYANSTGGSPLVWWAKTAARTVNNGKSLIVAVNQFNLFFVDTFYNLGHVSTWNSGDQIGTDGGSNPLNVGSEFTTAAGAFTTSKAIVTGTKIGQLLAANMNVTTDQRFAMLGAAAGSYIIRKIVAANASISLDTAVGGIYPSATKAGTAIVANTQVYSGLTGATLYLDLTVASVAATLVYTAAPYFSLTTAQGAAATADLFLFGEVLA